MMGFTPGNVCKHLMAELFLFFEQLSREHHLDWTEGQIKDLAEITGGYPLRMKEIALRELGGRQRYGGE